MSAFMHSAVSFGTPDMPPPGVESSIGPISLHNAIGLAACFGGLLFGKAALNPSLSAIDSEAERGKIFNTAWNRYNAINVASFATAAITWIPGRLGLSGKE